MTQHIQNMWYALKSTLSNGFLKQVGIYGLGQGVEGISSILLLPIFIVYLNPEDFAIVALGDMAGVIMASFWGLRLSASVTRFYYEYSGDDRDLFIGTIWWAVIINAIGGLLFVLTIGPIVLPHFVTQVAYSPYLELVVWTVFFRFFAEVPLAAMRIREEAHLVVGMTLGTFFLSVGAKLYYVVVSAQGGLGVLKAILLGSGVSALGYLIYMLRRYPRKIHWLYVKQAIQYCWPMTPDALLSGFTIVLDRFFLDKWVPMIVIGYYAVASQFGAIAYQSVVTLKMAFVPAVMRTWIEHTSERWKVGEMAFLLFGVVGTVALAVSLFAPDVLIAFGRERFASAMSLVPFMAANALLVALVTVVSLSLLLSKNTKWIAVVSSIHLAVAGIINLIFTPVFGVWGAVAATLAGWASRACFLAWVGLRHLPLPVPWKRVGAMVVPLIPIMMLGVQSWNIGQLMGLLAKLLLISSFIGYGIMLLWFFNRQQTTLSHAGKTSAERAVQTVC